VTTGERHARVIVADDHPILRIAMEQLLDSLPDVTAIAAAASGSELLDALAHAGADLILSPGLAGRLALIAGEPAASGTAPKLTAKEIEVVRLFASGASLTEISRQLTRSLTTAATPKRSAMRKRRGASNADLVAYARERGLA
jgi:DNA-binding NarL/FixJ family response regulator